MRHGQAGGLYHHGPLRRRRILSNNGIPHISLFINAPFNLRVRRVMDTDGLDKKGAAELLHQLDRRHRHYYEFYTGRRWGDPANYDLCLNSASYGIDGSVALVRQLIEKSAGVGQGLTPPRFPSHLFDIDQRRPGSLRDGAGLFYAGEEKNRNFPKRNACILVPVLL